MISKSLIKLIDEAILPALLLIVAKTFGILTAGVIYNLDFEVKTRGLLNLIPSISFLETSAFYKAENISNLFMFMVAAIGTLFVLLRVHFLHSSHVKPKLQLKLATLNLENIIAPTYHLYHQAAIWLVYLWLIMAFLFASTLSKITYPQITVFAFIIAANFSWIFALDVEKEIKIGKEKI